MSMRDTCCWFLTKDKGGKDQHALIRTTCLLFFLTYSINHKGEQERFEEQTPPEFRCLSSLYVLHSQYVYSKPHYGFIVFPLFTFYILNTHIVNRMAVSLFIGQGWRATSTLSPSDEQEANAKGVAFSSDRCLS